MDHFYISRHCPIVKYTRHHYHQFRFLGSKLSALVISLVQLQNLTSTSTSCRWLTSARTRTTKTTFANASSRSNLATSVWRSSSPNPSSPSAARRPTSPLRSSRKRVTGSRLTSGPPGSSCTSCLWDILRSRLARIIRKSFSIRFWAVCSSSTRRTGTTSPTRPRSWSRGCSRSIRFRDIRPTKSSSILGSKRRINDKTFRKIFSIFKWMFFVSKHFQSFSFIFKWVIQTRRWLYCIFHSWLHQGSRDRKFSILPRHKTIQVRQMKAIVSSLDDPLLKKISPWIQPMDGWMDRLPTLYGAFQKSFTQQDPFRYIYHESEVIEWMILLI